MVRFKLHSLEIESFFFLVWGQSSGSPRQKMLMWRCGNGLARVWGGALIPLLYFPLCSCSLAPEHPPRVPVPQPLQVKLHCTRGRCRVRTALLRNTPKHPFYWCGHWPSSYKLHFWFPSLACGWTWVVWEGVSAHFPEQEGQSQHCILSIALPGAEGGSWECSSPGIPCWKEEAGPAWDVPAGRGKIRGQGLHGAGAEPEGAGSRLPV